MYIRGHTFIMMNLSQMSPRLSRSPQMKAKWLANTLAYQYGHSKPSKNELIVLSNDLDQYLQEIFFSLDSQGKGKISSQDFKILCDILYLRDDSILAGLAEELDFADFHEKLCEHFACYGDFTGFLVNRNFRAVNTSSDNLRRAIKFQKKLALQHTHRCMHDTEIFKNWDKLRLSGFRLSEMKEHIDALLFEVAYHKEESQSLKEIIEDLRSLLQSSDAQNLALKVAVKKMQQLVVQDADKTCKSINRLSLPMNNMSYKPLKGEERSIRKLARELTELRALRDKEVNELIIFNNQLQYDLTDMSREICRLEDENRKVQKQMEAIINMYAHCRQLFAVCVESFREAERSQEDRSQEPTSGNVDEETSNDFQSLMKEDSLEGRESDETRCIQEETTDINGASKESEFQNKEEEPDLVLPEDILVSRLQSEIDECEELCKQQKLITVEGLLNTFLAHGCKLRQLFKEATKYIFDEQEKRRELSNEAERQEKDLEVCRRHLQTANFQVEALETECSRLLAMEDQLVSVFMMLQKGRTQCLSRKTLGQLILDVIDSSFSEDGSDMTADQFLRCLQQALTDCPLLTFG